MTHSHYSVVRYLPDPTNGEQINIGIICWDDEGQVRSRWLSDWSRVEAFAGKDGAKFAQEYARMSGPWPPSKVLYAAAHYSNCIQVSQPFGGLMTVDEMLATMAPLVLAEPKSAGEAAAGAGERGE